MTQENSYSHILCCNSSIYSKQVAMSNHRLGTDFTVTKREQVTLEGTEQRSEIRTNRDCLTLNCTENRVPNKPLNLQP